MACATMCLLLLHQSQPYENPSIVTEYSSCIHSMRFRYLKRLFIIGKDHRILFSLTPSSSSMVTHFI